MMYLGDYVASGKVAFLWNTNAIAGESITRATDGTLKIFKAHATAATWATERSSLAGVTQLEDFDATGIHSVYIDLSDNTDAGFYVAGAEYSVAIVGAVVDGKTVNVPLAHFSIERAGGVAAILARLPAALVSGRIDASVGADAVGLATAANLAAAAAYIDTEVAAILAAVDTEVATLVTNLATAQTAIDAIPTNAELATALGTADDATLAAIAALTIPTAAAVADAVWDELAVDHTVSGSAGQILGDMEGNVQSISNAVSSGGAGLTSIPWNGDWSSSMFTVVSNAIWDEPLIDHQTSGTIGEAIADVQTQANLIPGTQDGFTFAEYVKLSGAVLLGEASGLDTTTAVYRSMDDTADRVTATVDTDGNRSAVTLSAA